MWLPGLRTFPDPKPTVKQKLAAVRMLYDFLVVRQITPSNPAHSVRGPKLCGQERQDARLEPRRCQNAAEFNPKGFGFRLTGPGAHRHDVLQLRPCERGTETQSR